MTVGPVRKIDLEGLAKDPEQLGGGAWTTRRVNTEHISYRPAAGEPGVPNAYFTWYDPRYHELGFTADECDALLDSIDSYERNDHNHILGTIDPDGPGAGWYPRLAAVFMAANAAWWRMTFNNLETIRIREYRADGQRSEEWAYSGYQRSMDPHVDFPLSGGHTYRLVMSVLLNDDYEGGDLLFHHATNETSAPRERGTAIVFPFWLLHRVTTVTSGRRFALVTRAREHAS